MPGTITVAIGRNTHTLVWKEAEDFEEQPIANSEEGARYALQMRPDQILFVGNREWAIAMAHWLRTAGIEVRYLAKPTEKGSRQSMAKFARAALGSGITGRFFFEEKRPSAQEEEHPWYRTAREYLSATNEVRRAKHLILSDLSVLFPEGVKPSLAEQKKGLPVPQPTPPDIWTKKMQPVLENPDPRILRLSRGGVPAEVRTLASRSLALSLSGEVRGRYEVLHKGHLANLRHWEARKIEAMERLQKMVGEHPMAADWPMSDSVVVVIGLLGWRKWPHWRELRSFAGLAVTRLDSRGKPRISRVRGEVRQYLYLLATRTKLGKELAGPAKKRVKRIERLLKELRLRYLK